MSQNYAAKANAAIYVLRYQHSNEIADMEKAAEQLAESLEHFRTLTKLTSGTYHFANSMQTSQRKIPMVGGIDGKPAHYHWSQMLPVYERELSEFRARADALRQGVLLTTDESTIRPLPKGSITLLGDGAELYNVNVGERVWTDRKYTIES